MSDLTLSATRRVPGRIEMCRACNLSFDQMAGESTASLIYRYSSWREAHEHAGPASGEQEANDA